MTTDISTSKHISYSEALKQYPTRRLSFEEIKKIPKSSKQAKASEYLGKLYHLSPAGVYNWATKHNVDLEEFMLKTTPGSEERNNIHVAVLSDSPLPRTTSKEPLKSAQELFALYTEGYAGQTFYGLARQDTTQLADSLLFELRHLNLDPKLYTKDILLSYAAKFKEWAQIEFDKAYAKDVALKQKEASEREKREIIENQAFWNEVRNLKVVDFEVQHDVNPDRPTRTYLHVYDRTFAILENGKKVQVSYTREELPSRNPRQAINLPKEYYTPIYCQYMGKLLSEWITYEDMIRQNRYETYKAQQPKPRFTFIPEEPLPRVALKTPSPAEIKQQYTLKLQLAKSFDELQPIRNEITFLQLPQADKNQLIDIYNKRYSILTQQRPFGMPFPPKQQEKPRILGAPTRQQQFEEEQHRKAEAEKRARGQQKLTAVGSRRLFEFGIKENRQRYYPRF